VPARSRARRRATTAGGWKAGWFRMVSGGGPVGKDDGVADVAWVIAVVAGVAAIVWGAEAFAEHLAPAAVALRVSTFALALLLAGAEPEELATGLAASVRHAPAVAFGDVIGANVAMCF